ncbi:MAG TPA: helix-turn-helix domain-containing protein [Trebonia sp.]
MHRVGILVLDEMPLFEIAVPCEVFGTPRPDLISPAYEVMFCRPQDQRTRTGGGLVVDSPHGIDALASADTVIVPALPTCDAPVPDAAVEALRDAAGNGARIASICSGAFALAEAGLLDGRRATTHWMYAAALAARYPAVEVCPDVLYTIDGRLCTSAGTAAGLDLCLELVRQDHGSAVAADLARRLVVPPHRQGGQAQYVMTPIPAAVDDSLSLVLDWARERLDTPLSLAQLAAAAHTSPRTLSRRFIATLGTTPMQWLTNERVRRGQELLETTRLSVDQVARACGLGTPANFRTHFTRVTGTTPTAYRAAFTRSPAGSPAGR